MQRPVLIVIDMLQDFLKDWEPQRRQQLVASTNELAEMLRKSDCPVFWVRQEFEPDLHDAFAEMRSKEIRITIKGTDGCQMDRELVVAPSDMVIVKKRYSAFFGTKLDETLSVMQPDAIILAGINTHACIRTTAIDAYQRDWNVVLAADCIDSYDHEHHEISMRYMRDKIAVALTNAEIRSKLHSRN
jgi:nicotinamidase-related amidase